MVLGLIQSVEGLGRAKTLASPSKREYSSRPPSDSPAPLALLSFQQMTLGLELKHRLSWIPSLPANTADFGLINLHDYMSQFLIINLSADAHAIGSASLEHSSTLGHARWFLPGAVDVRDTGEAQPGQDIGSAVPPSPQTRPQETTTASIDKAEISVEELLDGAWVQAVWELEEGQTPGGDRQLQEPCAVGLWTLYFPCSYSMELFADCR